MGKKVYIYTLAESESDAIRYVGQTVSPQNRLSNHIGANDLPPENPKRKWIDGVIRNGGNIELKVIEECDLSIAQQREQHWINHYSSIGHELTNSRKATPNNSRKGRGQKDKHKSIFFRPTNKDATVLDLIHKNNPLFSGADLLRIALQEWCASNK